MVWQVAAAQAALGFLSDRAKSKAQKAWQKYQNAMTNLSNAESQNAITMNEIFANQASAMQALDIRKSFLATEATNEVSAAAAGVKGRSVNQVIFDVQRTANIAEANRIETLNTTNLSFDKQRQGSAMSAAMQQDYSYIPKPSFLGSMLGAAMGSYGSTTGASAGSGNWNFGMIKDYFK